MLPNGCTTCPPAANWTFTWSAVPGATAYHLDVGSFVDMPGIVGKTYEFVPGGVVAPNLQAQWSVRAAVQGTYQAWSPANTFSIQPPPSLANLFLKRP